MSRIDRSFLAALGMAGFLGLAGMGRGEPPVVTVPHWAERPQIDGRISETGWRGARTVILSGKGDSQTVARIAWVDDGLYLALEAEEGTPFSREPDPLEGSYHRQDVFEIFIDPIGDARQYYEIQVALSGAVFFKNFLLTAKPEVSPEGFLTADFRAREWWPSRIPTPEGFRSAGRYDPEMRRWTAEVFLPAAAFLNRRREKAGLQPGRMRINLARHDWRNENEHEANFSYWAPVKPGHPHISPTLMGTLVLEGPAARE